ncbi:MAG: hypothetical protein M1540_02815 [Candidatus Bathyarchaeota archaeon]|nr:hypothetical protein [Candidatus Bathyarchaeota archaeon]
MPQVDQGLSCPSRIVVFVGTPSTTTRRARCELLFLFRRRFGLQTDCASSHKQTCRKFGHSLKSKRPHSNAGITLKNWKTIGKIATFFAIVAFVFTAFQAATTYLLLALYSTGAPAEYIALYILNTITPYLVIAVLSVIVAVMAKGETEEQPIEALPQEEEQNQEVNA